jgi:hypothetical protein
MRTKQPKRGLEWKSLRDKLPPDDTRLVELWIPRYQVAVVRQANLARIDGKRIISGKQPKLLDVNLSWDRLFSHWRFVYGPPPQVVPNKKRKYLIPVGYIDSPWGYEDGVA